MKKKKQKRYIYLDSNETTVVLHSLIILLRNSRVNVRKTKYCVKVDKTVLKEYIKRYDDLDELIRGVYENFVAGLLPERQWKFSMKKIMMSGRTLSRKDRNGYCRLQSKQNTL